jgi:hypothetical protein
LGLPCADRPHNDVHGHDGIRLELAHARPEICTMPQHASDDDWRQQENVRTPSVLKAAYH